MNTPTPGLASETGSRILKEFGWRFIDGFWTSEQHTGNFSEREALDLVAKELEHEHKTQLKHDLDAYWNDPDYH